MVSYRGRFNRECQVIEKPVLGEIRLPLRASSKHNFSGFRNHKKPPFTLILVTVSTTVYARALTVSTVGFQNS